MRRETPRRRRSLRCSRLLLRPGAPSSSITDAARPLHPPRDAPTRAADGRPREALVTHDDVHLGVVEERVLVQVRRADGQPAVVDDPDLRVHVHQAAVRLEERAGEEAVRVAAVLRRPHEHAELAARVVAAVVRLRRKQDEDAEVGVRRLAQLPDEDLGQLGRPEKLALEIDEPLRRAKRALVALENRELTARKTVVEPLGHGAHELRLDAARRGGRSRRVERARPAKAEVLRDVVDERAFDTHARVVPADARAAPMLVRVEPVAAERCEIEAADVGDAIVDDDELLVMTVHRPLLRVERHLDPRAAHELVADRAHLGAVGMKER